MGMMSPSAGAGAVVVDGSEVVVTVEGGGPPVRMPMELKLSRITLASSGERVVVPGAVGMDVMTGGADDAVVEKLSLEVVVVDSLGADGGSTPTVTVTVTVSTSLSSVGGTVVDDDSGADVVVSGVSVVVADGASVVVTDGASVAVTEGASVVVAEGFSVVVSEFDVTGVRMPVRIGSRMVESDGMTVRLELGASEDVVTSPVCPSSLLSPPLGASVVVTGADVEVLEALADSDETGSLSPPGLPEDATGVPSSWPSSPCVGVGVGAEVEVVESPSSSQSSSS